MEPPSSEHQESSALEQDLESQTHDVADQILIRHLGNIVSADRVGRAALAELVRRYELAQHKQAELEQTIQTDQLTGLLSVEGLRSGVDELHQMLQKTPDEWLWRPDAPRSIWRPQLLDPAAPVTGAEVAVFDMNGFKILNDTYGHSEGDKAIQTFAARLRGSFRETDLIARSAKAGDEFIVVMPVSEDEAGIAEETIVRKLMAGVRDMKDYAREVGMSDPQWLDLIDSAYGIAHITFAQGMDIAAAVDEAVDYADERMRLNKGDKAR